MAQLTFYAGGASFAINNLAGSGLGFFGGGFGQSVPVGSFQTTTWITDGNGVNQGPQVNNIEYLNSQSGIINSATSGVNLLAIPNNLSSLNPEFTNASAVKTQSVQLQIYDRSNINNNPSGVTCYVSECVHPDPIQNNNGSGSQIWQQPTGSSVIMTLTSSPGTSGLRPNGASTTDVRHDWYLAISASPNSIGSKNQFALYMSLQYL